MSSTKPQSSTHSHLFLSARKVENIQQQKIKSYKNSKRFGQEIEPKLN